MTAMKLAKLFMKGRSQAVRLPAEYRFEGSEVVIRRDPLTGDITLSPVQRKFDEFLRIRQQLIATAPEEFAGFEVARDLSPASERDWP